MRHVLDLDRRRFTHQRGEITVIGTWARPKGEWEPCLALVRTGHIDNPTFKPGLIHLSDAYIFSEDPYIGEPETAAMLCIEIMRGLRLNNADRLVPRRIAGIIHDFLQDLIEMPPYYATKEERDIIGTFKIENREAGTRFEMETRDE